MLQKRNKGTHRLKIIRIIRETNDTKTFILDPVGAWQPGYKAGQFVTLIFNTKYGEKRRSYSISSAPLLHEPLSITIKKVDNGEFSRLLLSHAKTGDILYCSGISGLFLVPENVDSYQQYFFIAAGSGITPCFSLIKTILATGKAGIVLIYSNKTKEDTIFYEQLQKLQHDHKGRFIIYFLFSDSYDIYRSRLSNWLLQKLLSDYLTAAPHDVLFYLCGPFEYMRTATIALLSQVPSKNILKENFNSLPHVIFPEPPDKKAHAVIIHFDGSKYKLKVKYPQSILSAAKANNIALPYSCEAGRCGSCVATCIQGKIWMAYNEVLMEDEISKGRVLLCQAFPVETDAEILV